MKKIILLILFTSAYLTSFSQNRIPVTIIKTDNSQIICDISTYEGKIVSNFTFKIWVNNKKIKIARSEIKEIIADGNKYITIEYIKKTRRGGQITSKKVKRTAELLLDGKVELYAVYSIMTSGISTFNNIPTTTGTHLETSHFLVSNNTSFINKTNFKKVIKKYFLECNKLNLKIKSNELKYDQIKEAVKIGNTCN